MLGIIDLRGVIAAFIGIVISSVLCVTLGIYDFGIDLTPDEMTEVVQGLENVDKGVIELTIGGLGEATKAIYRLYIGLVNDITNVGDVGDGVDLLFGTFSDMTGIGFGSTFESFVDGVGDEMASNLNKYFDKLTSSLYSIF